SSLLLMVFGSRQILTRVQDLKKKRRGRERLWLIPSFCQLHQLVKSTMKPERRDARKYSFL
ncbi:hypothetical protein ACC772_39455, partial [Rhizobium ruizarguesonis]